MIKTIAQVALPVDEVLTIKKHRIMPEAGKTAGKISGSTLEKTEKTKKNKKEKLKRISIVTGIHGDELEGQYVCYELTRRIEAEMDNLTGIVDIYPAINPLGIDSITRGIPAFDLDMNRLFPGNIDGNMTEFLAADIIKDVSGSDVVFDIHASNIYLTEIPQIRINELHEKELVPLAAESNIDFIWVHGASTVLESTFAYSLNSTGTPCLVVEMGVGMRITKEYGDQMVDGILNLMKKMGMWQGTVNEPRTPIISKNPDDVCFFNASTGGLFLQTAKHWQKLSKGDEVGLIIDPLSGKILDRVVSPEDGLLFTIREYPIVDEGSLIGRLLRSEALKSGARTDEDTKSIKKPERRTDEDTKSIKKPGGKTAGKAAGKPGGKTAGKSVGKSGGKTAGKSESEVVG